MEGEDSLDAMITAGGGSKKEEGSYGSKTGKRRKKELWCGVQRAVWGEVGCAEKREEKTKFLYSGWLRRARSRRV